MSYILHIGKEEAILSDEEYESFKTAADNGTWFERKSNGERINPPFVTHAEKIVELPKAELGAVDRFMERRRAEGNHNPQKRKN